MNKFLTICLAVSGLLFSVAAQSAAGEYWEVTSKMEMVGMPFAMPSTTVKVCIPKGGENDPRKTSGDKDCQMTDIKTVGNKTSWKARCTHDGEVMTGSGEQTTTANGYDGKIHFSGKSSGQDMDMKMAFSGKRVGGSCDSEEMVNKAKAQLCDTSHYRNTADWISGADLFLQKDSPCTEQRKLLCEKVRKDAPRDTQTFNMLLMHDTHQSGNVSIAKECKLDMAATTKTICKTLNASNYADLSAHCPAEAKSYREVQRRKDCEGRSYTAETRAADIKKCLSGREDEPVAVESNQDEPPAPRKSARPAENNPTADVLEGAKKLKGLFGY